MYKITYDNRRVIEKKRKEGWSYRKIAREIGLSKTAIFHEVKTKSNGSEKYEAEQAHFRSEITRHRLKTEQRKIHRPEILELVEKQLNRKKSPYDIACYIKKKYFPSLRKISEGAKKKFSIWEVDTMYLRSGFIVAAVERVSKKIMATRIPNLQAETMDQAMRFLFSRVTKIHAVICDRGSENVHFANWQRFLNTRVYACDPSSPWQKGLVEGSIRQLRCTFKRDMPYSQLSNKELYLEAARLNHMHRASLNGKSSHELYHQNLLKVS